MALRIRADAVPGHPSRSGFVATSRGLLAPSFPTLNIRLDRPLTGHRGAAGWLAAELRAQADAEGGPTQ
ncbi:hypothetical protein GCM10011610_36300 [Nocardia rhizosphaerihabitans]|uniref:Uncharacterized protein n=1 Tax=Nocardia rhizosphaerihabitans TaxID=1691570 RepID=A0ABQ2KHK9_9NOCA|nr:hypothetical protein GCM10011610_36300 [Nocardia rhizosphaerihabitans]